MDGSVLIMVLIGYMERYRFGFGQTGSTLLVLVHVEFECVIAWYTMHHSTIAIAHSRAIQLH